MLSTKEKSKLTKTQKDAKISKYRADHKELLDFNNAKDTDFNVKTVFTNKGQKIVGLFANECTKPNGFYFEFVDSELDTTDPERTVYVIKERANYENVYKLLAWGQYAVPIEELEVAPKPTKFKQVLNYDAEKLNVENVKKDDDHFSKMTIRDFAAIIWQEPVSDRNWLNDLVNGIKAKL